MDKQTPKQLEVCYFCQNVLHKGHLPCPFCGNDLVSETKPANRIAKQQMDEAIASSELAGTNHSVAWQKIRNYKSITL